jgi:hypothetical protein
MKRLITLLLSMMLVIFVSGQETGKNDSDPGRFHIGINYSYINTDLECSFMSFHSIWKGDDYGTHELDQAELDDVNASSTFNKSYSGIALEAGYTILDKPGSPWFIDVSIMLGLMQTAYENQNSKADSVYFKVNSGMDNPAAGLKFRVDYAINNHWGVSVVPYFVYAWGKPSDIDDQMNTSISFFNETQEFSFNYWYARLCPMAYYEIKNVRISAGPGFYYLYMNTKYSLKRVNPDTGFSYDDYINTRAASKSFIDGNLAVSWRIIDHLTLNAFIAGGSDIIGHAGIIYTF